VLEKQVLLKQTSGTSV